MAPGLGAGVKGQLTFPNQICTFFGRCPNPRDDADNERHSRRQDQGLPSEIRQRALERIGKGRIVLQTFFLETACASA